MSTTGNTPLPNGMEGAGMVAQPVNPENMATRAPEPPFAMSFPDVTFDGSMMWQEGVYQNAVWDVMLNDMTTLPFG